MSYDKRKLTDYLAQVFKFSTLEAVNTDTVRRQLVLGGRGDELVVVPDGKSPIHFALSENAPPGVTIYDEGCDALDSFVEEYSRDVDLSLRVGPNAVQEKVTNLVSELAAKDRSALDFDSLLKDRILKPLKGEIRTWQVVIPLVNVNVEYPLVVGNTTLMPFIDGFLRNVDLMNGHDFGGGEEKAKSDKFCFLKVVSDVAQQCSSWALATVEAHSSRIYTVATEEVDGALNVIRSFVHAFYTRELKCTFGMMHEICGTKGVFIADANREHINISFENQNTLASFELSEKIIQSLKQVWCFDVLSGICATRLSERTSLQRAIYIANHWLGRSTSMMTREESLTSCTIAIERLIVLDGEQATVEKFSERLAYLLSDIPNERRTINRIAKRLYDIRSQIVHSGYRGIRDSDYVQMECFAMHAVAKTAKLSCDLKKHEDLIAWFNDRKFS